MNKSSNLFLGGIFVAGMATTYLLRQMKVMGAETRIFNACSYHQPQSLTSDGYETNSPNPSSVGASSWAFIKSNPHGAYPVQLQCGASKWNMMNTTQAKSFAKNACSNPWKDMTKSPQTSCPHCCVASPSSSGSGSSGGSSSSSTQTCPACDSCCPTIICPECVDCGPQCAGCY